MRVAALYDIHGNLPALEAVLADVDRIGVDRIVVGGDVIPGPMPGGCVETLLGVECAVSFISGNGEREVFGLLAGGETKVPEPFREALVWSGRDLTAEQAGFLSELPSTARFEIPGVGEVLFCHAAPASDSVLVTPRTAPARMSELYGSTGADLVVCGHTHMQFDRAAGDTRAVNAGSVGMPFGEPGAYWLLLGPDVELLRTDYDLDAAADRIRATEYPDAEDFARDNVLEPPAAADMIELYEAAVERMRDAGEG